jgi:hypothetical protein
MMTAKLFVDPNYVNRAANDDFANAFARIENMYFVNGVSTQRRLGDAVWLFVDGGAVLGVDEGRAVA